ncbi:hypothetical protein [Microbacterium plantarum]|uniref:Uncharacterized protein n=1 Tax=Microbacterium plantarum TaxID=1816425 RepID=A0ABV5EUF2_9MICO
MIDLPVGYVPVLGVPALAIWAEDPETDREIRAINELMLSALYRLDAQTIRTLEDGDDVVARDDETHQAIADFREAYERQSILLRSIESSLQ